jgi:hypothetical protein
MTPTDPDRPSIGLVAIASIGLAEPLLRALRTGRSTFGECNSRAEKPVRYWIEIAVIATAVAATPLLLVLG